MNIAVGNDHRGVSAKERVLAVLHGLGHTVTDMGTGSATACDYPDFAFPVAEAVSTGAAERGVLIDASGHGMCIAANKVSGVRAANCRDVVDAELSRGHNDANVLCLAADLVGDDLMERLIRAWLDAPFDGGRHARRLERIRRYEQERGKP